MSAGFVLTAAAEADLRDIVRYTRKQWGEPQVRTYIASLKHGIGRLVNGQHDVRNIDMIYPDLRMLRCEHHYIFGLSRDSAPMMIIAIFHERMDLISRLTARLTAIG